MTYSYLSNRSHYVQIDAQMSTSVNIQFGVPQGSIMGPMLFNLYVADLQDNLPSTVTTFQYADDTTLYTTCRPVDVPHSAESSTPLYVIWGPGQLTHIRHLIQLRQRPCCYLLIKWLEFILWTITAQVWRSLTRHYGVYSTLSYLECIYTRTWNGTSM